MNTRKKNRGKKVLGCTAALAMAFAMGLSALPPATAFALSENATQAKKGWMTDFETIEEEHELAAELNLELMAEGMVLLKNENNALPLSKKERNVTLFGNRSYLPFYSGTGSGGKHGDIMVDEQDDGTVSRLTDSFEKAGFRLNPRVKKIYAENGSNYKSNIHSNGKIRVEAPVSLLASAKGSYFQYGDAAITTISRVGGEDNDLRLTEADHVMFQDETAHTLQLDDNEKALIKEMGENFNKVIVLINSGNVLELGDLEDDPNVDAVLWVGQPGTNGFEAVPKLLTGEINPSGKTVDIYPANLKSDPTWNNFGNYNVFDVNGGGYNTDGKKAKAVEYEEGIYYGYKWYETAAADKILTTLDTYDATLEGLYPEGKTAENDEYYNRSNGVVYPFGHGLSYTTFEQELVTTAADLTTAINAASGLDTKVPVKVKVTNTGKVEGKEVVQMYVHAPYNKTAETAIEKAEVVFAGYAKTGLLNPGESETVTVEIRLGDIASFDYSDANGNGYKGYEIEAGAYEFRLQKNSHEMIEKLDCTLTAKTTELDNDSDAANNTLFSNGDIYDTRLNVVDNTNEDGTTRYGTMTTMSRKNFKGTYPTVPTTMRLMVVKGGEGDTVDSAGYKIDENGVRIKEPKEVKGYTYSDRVIQLLKQNDTAAGEKGENNLDRFNGYYNSDNDEASDPWYVTNADLPENWTQASDEDVAARENGRTEIGLVDMIGLDYWDNETVIEGGKFNGKTHKEAWEAFMNLLSYGEMTKILSDGKYRTIALNSIGKEEGRDADGPAMFTEKGFFWCSAVNIASTFNDELAYRMGVMVGNESLLLNAPGWYGPSVNIHRSAFGGRNFEYYSQDPVQGGRIASAVIRGATSKGVNCYVKHFGFNEQETNRNGLGTFVDEQSLRENYFKVFEIIVKESNTTGLMTAFGRTGAIGSQGNYMHCTALTRDEWGFKGVLITDAYIPVIGQANMMQRAGCDLPLGQYGGDDSIHGVWDKTLRDGKGGVRDGAEKDGVVPESPTQYKAVRDSAMRLLWMSANSNICETSVDATLFADRSFTVMAGQPMKTGNEYLCSVGVELPEGTSATYQITKGNLPIGMGFSEVTGNFEDIPQQCGTFELEIAMVVNGWSKKTAKVTMNVDPLVKIDKDISTLTQNEEFVANIVPDKGHMGLGDEYRQDDPYIGFALEYQGGLPEGSNFEIEYDQYEFDMDTFTEEYGYQWEDQATKAEIAADKAGTKWNKSGKIKVTASEPGTYDLTFRYGAYRASNGKVKSWRYLRYTFVVAPDGSSDPVEGKTIVSIDKTSEGLVDTYTILYDDNTTYEFTVKNGADGADGTNGTNGTDGVTPTVTIGEDGYWVINGVKTDVKATGKDGVNGQDGKPGADGEAGKPGADGTNGTNGKDGTTPTIEVSEDGYWVINGVKTEYKAAASEGGCGSAIESAGAIGISLAVLAAALAIGCVLRKKKD